MVDARESPVPDPLLRMAGLILLAVCGLLMRWLFDAADPGQHRDPSLIEYVAAAIGFVCFSVGAALTMIGAHIFDPVETSQRWRRHRHSQRRGL